MRGPPRIPTGRILRSSGRATQAATASSTSSSPSSVSPRVSARGLCLVSVPSSPSACRSSSSSCSPPPSAYAAYEATHSWRDLVSPFGSEAGGWGSEGAAGGGDELGGFWYAEGFVFGSPPSEEEVEEAVSTIQQIFIPTTSLSQAPDDVVGPAYNCDQDRLSETSNDTTIRDDCSTAESRRPDWVEPRLRVGQSGSGQSLGPRNKLMDAFHSLQTDASVQKMVVSLSSDKAVWAAVMRNEAVKNLRQSLCSDEAKDTTSGRGRPTNAACKIVTCMLLNTRAKLLQFLQQITRLINGLLQPQKKRKMDAVEESIRSSFMVSMVVFLVVVIFRVHKY